MRQIFALLVLIAGAALAADSEGESSMDPKALAVVERSQHTTSTYAVYSWNDVPDGGQFHDGWSAEYHDGDLHRVETPMSRSIANCRERTGTNLDLKTGEVISNFTVANAACGINTNFPFQALEWLERRKTAFGDADRIRVTDDHSVRTYDVLDNGASVTAVYVDLQGKPLVTAWATGLDAEVPKRIFTVESLNMSFVPQQYRRPPRKPTSPN